MLIFICLMAATPLYSASAFYPDSTGYKTYKFSSATPAPESDDESQFGRIARQHLEMLSNKIGARATGSAAEARAAQYIQSIFEKLGYPVKRQELYFSDAEDETPLHSANLIAVKKGDSERQIIVGAHYDSSTEGGKGADDNASGVSVLLETAERIKDLDTPYTIVFIAFGAEENNLDGSYYYTSKMSRQEKGNTVVMINLDGLISGDYTYIYGKPGKKHLRDWILADAAKNDFDLQAKDETDLNEEDGSPCDCGDFDAFQDIRIPFIFMEATNWESGEQDGWTQVEEKYGDNGVIQHTIYDTIAYLEKTFPGRIDRHLNEFVTLMVHTVTKYKEP